MSTFIQDLARVSLPGRGERGMFAMLEFYLDDSGTHKESRVIVWGGLVGYKDFWDQLEAPWKAQLAEPCEGKPPIKAFHSSHLAASDGEFIGYTPAERDLTRYNFRKLIVDAGLTALSFGISVNDWNDIITGPYRVLVGSAERMIFGEVILAGCGAARKEHQPISFQFDKGRHSRALETMILPSLEVSGIDKDLVSVGFSSVVQNVGLQAADLVAHETYQFLEKYVADPNAEPGPHLKRLIADTHDAKALWVGRKEIQHLLDKLSSTFDGIGPFQKGGQSS